MPSRLFKLVSLLLLVVQGAIASSPARVLCVSVVDCSERPALVAVTTDHHHAHERADTVNEFGTLVDTPASSDTAASHEHGCHMHVQLPPNEQLPSNPKGDLHELQSLAAALVAVVTLTPDVEPTFTIRMRSQPLDFSASDQVRALKTTRLLI
jgi:hypothetical protein